MNETKDLEAWERKYQAFKFSLEKDFETHGLGHQQIIIALCWVVIKMLFKLFYKADLLKKD